MRRLCREYILTQEGHTHINFNRIISFNETAAFLWKALADIDFSKEDMALLLEEKFNISHDRAMEDSAALLTKWSDAGLLQTFNTV